MSLLSCAWRSARRDGSVTQYKTVKRARAVTTTTPGVFRRIGSELRASAQPVQCGILSVSRVSKVAVPMGGPVIFLPVLTTYWPSELIVVGKRSMPRGAGPARFSPRMVYLLPWQRHSNQWLLSHSGGIWQPRWGHLR